MKKISAVLCVLLLLTGLAHAAFGIFQTYSTSGPVNMGGGPNMIERSVFASSTPNLPYSSWYVPGNGSPAISTSDYMLMNGFYWSRPYDLDTMGSDGATIKAREGYRYVWLICADHGAVSQDFSGSTDLFVGYSNDPQVLPEPTTMRTLYKYQTQTTLVDQNGATQTALFPYQIPHMEYNPDPGAFAPFYIYMEAQSNGFQHELTLLTSSDFLTLTMQGPAIPTTTFSGWSSYGKPQRLGVNNWIVYALGKIDGSAGTVSTYKYTSTDGWAWTPDYSKTALYVNPVVTISGQDWMINKEAGTVNDYLALMSVDSDRVYTGTTTRISTGFGPSAQGFTNGSTYPGPTYFQDIDAYSEDGITTIYLSRGFPTSGHDGTNLGPYMGNVPGFFDINASITSNVLTVNSVPGGVAPLVAPFRVGPNKAAITSQAAGTGGATCPDPTCNGTTGTYNLASTSNVATGSLTVFANGGLWQQFVDLYYLITDSTAAASAAPLGVKASCAAGVATVQWNNSLPHQNYRVYKGSSAGTQATLVGNVIGTSITDTPTANAQTWYKVVTMNVTEQKSRVVNVYCSANTAMVNKHINRVTNDGGAGIDITFLAGADSWLTLNNTYRYLQWWTDVRFGYKLDGSGFIARIYDLGTTLLPRGGDYTPSTSTGWPSTSSNTSYSATSFRGTTPSWINNASSAHGYFGNGRVNNMQRWTEITLLAAYQKPGTAGAALFGYGEFNGMYLRHESGSSGNITFALTPVPGVNTYQTATVPFSTATAAHVAGGVLDSSGNITAYLDGIAGTPVNDPLFVNPSLTQDTILRGQLAGAASNINVLASGGASSVRKPNYAISNEALFTGAGLAVFNKGLPAAQVQSWGALYN
jgi:hypothetical protein